MTRPQMTRYIMFLAGLTRSGVHMLTMLQSSRHFKKSRKREDAGSLEKGEEKRMKKNITSQSL